MSADTQFENDRRGRSLAVDWRDCAWQARIEVHSAMPPRRHVAAKPLSAVSPFYRPPRRNIFFLKNMKTKLPSSWRNRIAFTLVELLTVITIIAILASMLLVVLAGARKHAQKVQAKLQENDIVTAIQAYDSAYGRFPVSSNAQAVANSANSDFTYGGPFQTPNGIQNLGTPVDSSGDVLSNNEVIAILMDLTNYPGTTTPTVNANYVKNPQQTVFLNAKMSGWNPSTGEDPLPGVGTDLVYRDPWGNPYVITMDLNYDEMCRDVFYCTNTISQMNGGTGYNGLVDPTDPTGKDNNFEYRGKAMVWSAGPDKKIDGSVNANSGANKDNVLSWQ